MAFQAASKWYVLLLAYQSTGVIYGDLGTSPLYVFSSTFTQPPSAQVEVLGAMSLIFWTITLIGLLKYVVIVLNADDNGEGKTLLHHISYVDGKLCRCPHINKSCSRVHFS